MILTNYSRVKIIKRLSVHKKWVFVAAIFWTLTIAFFCLINSNDIPKMQHNMDKVGHFCFHFVFTILWFWYFFISNKLQNRNKYLMETMFLSIFYGVFIEICQSIFTTTRTADSRDVAANAVGMLTAIFLLIKFVKPKTIEI